MSGVEFKPRLSFSAKLFQALVNTNPDEFKNGVFARKRICFPSTATNPDKFENSLRSWRFCGRSMNMKAAEPRKRAAEAGVEFFSFPFLSWLHRSFSRLRRSSKTASYAG